MHRGRSDTEVECVATTVRILHLVHDICMNELDFTLILTNLHASLGTMD